MFGIFLWTFILIVWIGNIIIRTRPSMKNVEGNGFQILVAVMFIMLSIVNIVGRAVSLNSNASPETISETTETSIEEQTCNGEEFYYIEESY